eukprot:COSAG01_NODE_14865_length_1401_cov_1.728111_1_plen_183_part_01
MAAAAATGRWQHRSSLCIPLLLLLLRRPTPMLQRPCCCTTVYTRWGGRALRLGGRGGRAVRWVALPGPNREPAIISGGVLVTGWTPASSEQPPAIGAGGGRLTRWTAPLPAQVAAQSGQPKTMRVGSRRAPQVTFPAVDNHPAATRFLFAREVNASSLVPGAVVVKFDLAALPDGWQTWTSLV